MIKYFAIIILLGITTMSNVEDSSQNTWRVESSKLFKYSGGYVIQSRIKRHNEMVIIRLKSEDVEKGDELDDLKDKDVILIKSKDALPERPIISVMGEFDLLRDRFTLIGENILVKNCQIIGIKKGN